MIQIMTFEQGPCLVRGCSTLHGEGETYAVVCTTSDEVIDTTRSLWQATGALDYDTNMTYDDNGNSHWVGMVCI